MPRKKIIKKLFTIIILVLLGAWLFIANFMMQDRLSDRCTRKLFAQKGVELTTSTKIIFGRHLHYAKTGNDTLPTIFFIHGSPGSWTVFMKYLYDKELLAKYRLVSIDRPGFGYSDFGHTLNLEKQSVLIAALIDSLSNNKPVYLVGHSLGGPLVAKIAAGHPQLINKLVILAGSVDPAQEKKEYWRPVLTYSPLRWLVPSAMRYANEELWYLKNDLKKLKNDLGKIVCPVLLLHGDKDGLVPIANLAYAQKMLRNAASIKTTVFPGANHFIVWTRFDEIKSALLTLSGQ